ncbi:MAG: NAD(P)H-binding protein [Pseudomonadota bacterium]
MLLLGASGTIGQATLTALSAAGYETLCLVRSSPSARRLEQDLPGGARLREIDLTAGPGAFQTALAGERIDAVISCLASRNGVPAEAWQIDHRTTSQAFSAAQQAGASRAVLLSALCVQRPKLAFQKAKLAMEADVIASGMRYSIVRPTAFFKSLSGQVARVQQGKPYLLFGNGELTACKPIGDADLAQYLVACLSMPEHQNRILPIGGPGPAVTPRDLGRWLFDRLARPPRFRHVPVGLISGIARGLSALGRISPKLRTKAELPRIARYYATEPMLVFDPVTGRHDEAATPSFGNETIFDHYERLISGDRSADLGAHRVFAPAAASAPRSAHATPPR